VPFFVSAQVEQHRIGRMVDATGLEPVQRLLQADVTFTTSVGAETADTHLRTQNLADLCEVIAAWPKLSAELRAAVLAVTRTAMK